MVYTEYFSALKVNIRMPVGWVMFRSLGERGNHTEDEMTLKDIYFFIYKLK